MSVRTADYFIHGRGRGHISRSTAVLSALHAEGYRVRLHTGGDALDLLPGQTPYPFELRSRAALHPGPLAPLQLIGRVTADTLAHQRSRPSLVVSDGDQSALLASRACAIPSLAVGHDLVFSGRVRLPNLPKGALLHQRANGLPLSAARRAIAVHFLPASSLDPELRVARPETVEPELLQAEVREHIVCYFRDQNGQSVAHALGGFGRDVLWFGPEADSSEYLFPRSISAQTFRQALARARCVVGSAGSNLLAECVLLNKPVLALYRRSDAEQLLNAHLVEGAGVGMACAFDEASPTLLRRFMARVKAGDFARVDLAAALPSLSMATREALAEACEDFAGFEAFA
jgi:UDP-N-acetylglucosamine--N-acetylmuramyl-(pentapeptide) pyrophosphoryl-undecaprenol N-acetylglucosamine transferase